MPDTESADHKRLIEAALLMSPEPLSLEMLSRIAGVHSLGYLRETLAGLERDYAERGFHLVESGDGWAFQVDREFLPSIQSSAEPLVGHIACRVHDPANGHLITCLQLTNVLFLQRRT